MPKLLIISPSANLFGGVESIIDDLCRGLPEHGWELVLGLTHGKYFHDADLYRRTYPYLPIYKIANVFASRRSRVAALLSAIRKIKPDLVLISRIGDAYEAAAICKTKCGYPRLAATARGFELQYLVDIRGFEKVIDLCVTDGLLVSAACKEIGNMQDERIVSIPGGVRSPSVFPKPRDCEGFVRVAYVGRLNKIDKRVMDLVSVSRILNESGVPFSLDIAGSGPHGEELESRLSEHIPADKLNIHGKVDHEYLYRKLFPNVDCILNFSPTEGVTIAPREGMANGVIPIVSEFPGLKLEGIFVNEKNSLTFPVGDVDKAAQLVTRLVDEPGLSQKLSRNASQAQTGKYLSEGAILEWLHTLDECLNRPMKIGPYPKVVQKEKGRLERVGMPGILADFLRYMAGREIVPTDPGVEWPHGRIQVADEDHRQFQDFIQKTESSL